ncbi:MAG: outer membrane lipoprotein LolB [Burkholderiaceae bacterium]|nr:outer membrane lipoprotein LolB [Burkholderiaceae bacterium]
MSFRVLVAAAGLAAATVLSGCATTAEGPVRQAVGETTQPLELSGRFTTTYVTSLPETRRESASGRFELYKDASRLTVDLLSPFGQTIARAEQLEGESARLRTSDGKEATGATLEEVFQRAIGIRVPAARLPDWLSDRFERVVHRSPDGRHVSALDAGWQIERDGGRWDLVWHEGTQRVEVRLLLDAD